MLRRHAPPAGSALWSCGSNYFPGRRAVRRRLTALLAGGAICPERDGAFRHHTYRVEAQLSAVKLTRLPGERLLSRRPSASVSKIFVGDGNECRELRRTTDR